MARTLLNGGAVGASAQRASPVSLHRRGCRSHMHTCSTPWNVATDHQGGTKWGSGCEEPRGCRATHVSVMHR